MCVSLSASVAPDLGLGLALRPEDALPPDPAHDLSPLTTRGTGKPLSLHVSHSLKQRVGLSNTFLVLSPASCQCFYQDILDVCNTQ